MKLFSTFIIKKHCLCMDDLQFNKNIHGNISDFNKFEIYIL
jgi:hypothetical protein